MGVRDCACVRVCSGLLPSPARPGQAWRGSESAAAPGYRGRGRCTGPPPSSCPTRWSDWLSQVRRSRYWSNSKLNSSNSPKTSNPIIKKLKQKIFGVFYDLVVYQNSRRWIPWINLLINQLIISALLKISSVLLFVSLLHSVFTRMFCSKCSVSCFSLQNNRKPFFF